MTKRWPRPLSYTSMKELAKSPAHILAYWRSERRPATKSMRIGKLTDYFFLTDIECCVVDGHKKDEIFFAEQMADNLEQHNIASALAQKGIIEERIKFQDPDYGFDAVAIPDIRIPELGVIVDLKTAADVSFFPFRKAIYYFKYNWQAWWYLRAANTVWPDTYHTYLIIAIENKPPFGIIVYKLSESMLFKAEEDIKPLLALFADCLDTGDWPQYPEEIIEI